MIPLCEVGQIRYERKDLVLIEEVRECPLGEGSIASVRWTMTWSLGILSQFLPPSLKGSPLSSGSHWWLLNAYSADQPSVLARIYGAWRHLFFAIFPSLHTVLSFARAITRIIYSRKKLRCQVENFTHARSRMSAEYWCGEVIAILIFVGFRLLWLRNGKNGHGRGFRGCTCHEIWRNNVRNRTLGRGTFP